MFSSGAEFNNMISNIMDKKQVNFGELQVKDMGEGMIMMKLGDSRIDVPMDVMRKIMSEFEEE